MNLKIQLLPALVAILFSCNVFAGTSNLSTFPIHIFRCDTIPARADSVLIKFERVKADSGFTFEENVWLQYLQKNIDPHVPAENKAPTGTYTVIIQFILDREGNVSDVRALTNHGFGMEEEAMKTVKKSPKWVPAPQNRTVIKSYNKLYVTFYVEGKKKKKKKRNKDY